MELESCAVWARASGVSRQPSCAQGPSMSRRVSAFHGPVTPPRVDGPRWVCPSGAATRPRVGLGTPGEAKMSGGVPGRAPGAGHDPPSPNPSRVTLGVASLDLALSFPICTLGATTAFNAPAWQPRPQQMSLVAEAVTAKGFCGVVTAAGPQTDTPSCLPLLPSPAAYECCR